MTSLHDKIVYCILCITIKNGKHNARLHANMEPTFSRNDANKKLKQLLSIRKIKLLLTTETDSHTRTIKNTKNLNRFKSNFPKDNPTINTASSTNKPTD